MRPHWNELWKHCPEATPFQSPAWLIPWWKHLGEGRLSVYALWQDHLLAALAPFFIWDGSGQRQLLLLGTGVSDYLDVLWLPGYHNQAVHSMMLALQTAAEAWDVCDWQQIRLKGVRRF